jgi:hypothetical protein
MSSKYFSSAAEMWSYLLVSRKKIVIYNTILGFDESIGTVVDTSTGKEFLSYIEWKVAEPFKEVEEIVFFRRKWVYLSDNKLMNIMVDNPVWCRTISDFDDFYGDNIIDKSNEIQEKTFEIRRKHEWEDTEGEGS